MKSELVFTELIRPKQKWFTSDKASRLSFSSRKRQCKRPDEPDKVLDSGFTYYFALHETFFYVDKIMFIPFLK